MTRWMAGLSLGVVLLVVAVYAFRLGWIAANLTETEAIDAYAARYLSDAGEGARAEHCFAEPGDVYGVWIAVTCVMPGETGLIYSYYVNRFGGLSHHAVMDKAGGPALIGEPET